MARMQQIVALSVVGVGAALGLVFVGVAHPIRFGSPNAYWLFMAILGTQLGQTSLAAVWCAAGPGSLALRLPLSLVWMAAIVLVSGLNRSLFAGIANLDFVASAGLMLSAQWAFIAGPLWVLAEWRGVRIGHQSARHSASLPNNRQIGILGTMVITAAVAVVLAASPAKQHGEISINWDGVRELGFLAVVGVMVGLPCGAVALLLLKNWHAIMAMLLIVAIASVLAVIMLSAIDQVGIDAGLCSAVFLLNSVQSTWIIVTFLVMNRGGYEVIRRAARCR